MDLKANGYAQLELNPEEMTVKWFKVNKHSTNIMEQLTMQKEIEKNKKDD
ncbi:MAG: hypothetical protein MI921_23590 [Cytophagales bacterium]|nr:hypothetical protein [Cytophagales bacterium]